MVVMLAGWWMGLSYKKDTGWKIVNLASNGMGGSLSSEFKESVWLGWECFGNF
jgi:hypothetical protein